MKIWPRLFFIMLMLTLVLGPLDQVMAQGENISLHLERVDVTAYPQMAVHLSAWDASGLPLPNLQPEDFSLQEDGGAALLPTSVTADPQAPLSVVLVLDISGSMAGQPLADAKAAAARFLDRLGTDDRAALIAFSDSVNPDPNDLDARREIAFTTDLAPVYDLIEKQEAEGQTHLYNAAAKSVRMIAGLPAGHRAILLLSDGRNEPANVGDPDEAIQLAREANVPVFVIGLGNQIDEPYLRRLANETGGLLRLAPKSSELARLFTDMATLLKTQYVLSYDTRLPADGQKHTLTVTLNTPSGSASSTLEFGPLPEQPTPTATSELTSTPQEMNTPVLTPPVPSVVPTATKSGKNTGFNFQENWGWLLAAAIALVLGIWVSRRRRRRPPHKPESCAQCGHDLTGKPGACPQCGGSKRLPKR